jgi:hypothetical protein
MGRYFKLAALNLIMFLIAYGVFGLVRILGLLVVAVIAIVVSVLVIAGSYIDGRK